MAQEIEGSNPSVHPTRLLSGSGPGPRRALGALPAPWQGSCVRLLRLVLLTALVSGFYLWLFTSTLTGAGMALLYPTLIAAIGDSSPHSWRASALGVYRMWRDSGYAFGGLVIGLSMDIFGVAASFYITASLMIASGAVVAGMMRGDTERLHR